MIPCKTKGFICGMVAAMTYGMNPLFALPLYKEGLNADSVLFYRYGLAIVFLGLLMKWKGESFKLEKKEVLPLIIAGLIFSSSSLLLFLSYNYMDAGIASTILFVYPVLVALIMMVCFHERVSFVVWGGIALALCGISFLTKGTDGAMLSWVGLAFVLLSSLSYAVYIVGVNQSPAVRLLHLPGAAGFRHGAHPRAHLLRLGQCHRAGPAAHSRVPDMHDRRHPQHRLYAHSHPGSTGTGDRPLLRRHAIQRATDSAHPVGHRVSPDGRHPDCHRKACDRPLEAYPETFIMHKP